MPLSGLRLTALALLAATQITAAAPAIAQDRGFAGPYLAGLHARYNSDYRAAAQYYTRALSRDPSNARIMDHALMAFVGLGDVDKAVPVARLMRQNGAANQAAEIVLVADQIRRGAFDALLEDFEAGLTVGRLADGLLKAWAEFGAGRMGEALAAFDKVATDAGLGVFGDYHKALALAAVGDFEGADALMDGTALQFGRRGILAHLSVMSQLERFEDAVAMIDDIFGSELDPGLSALRDQLAAGQAVPFEAATTGADGAAEVLFTVAEALQGDANDTFTLLFSRSAEYLRPGHVDALLLTAQLLETQQQYELATQAYLQVPASHPSYYAAELGRAETLERSGKPDAAIEVLTQLAKTHANLPVVHLTLGNTLSAQKSYAEAVGAYDKAIDLIGEPRAEQWFLFFRRAIAYERLGDWPPAEADFRRALELSPEEPSVLNYLGYSFVEMRINFDEALDMIERAVDGRPDDGYITDSLGWVLYRLGRYEEAVPYMELAVALEPIDPVINDHLGDVLWAVGRKLEAEFQWKRALSFVDPDEVPTDLDPDRIRRKLEVGLDRVLADEGAAPLRVAEDQN